MLAPRFATIAVVAVGLAGCGGSEGSGASYSVEATRTCLDGTSADVDPDPKNVDSIALGADRGAIRAEFDGHEVIVSFSESISRAKDVKDAYDAVGSDDGRIDQKRNAVIAWSDDPTDEERRTVEDCLS